MTTQTTAVKLTKATMKRLKGFDYTKPYFYMETLKRVRGLRPFCEITKEKDPPKDARGRVRYLIANELTEAFARVIREFHTKWFWTSSDISRELTARRWRNSSESM